MNNRVGYSWIAVGLMFLSWCHAKPEADGKCEPQDAVEAQPSPLLHDERAGRHDDA